MLKGIFSMPDIAETEVEIMLCSWPGHGWDLNTNSSSSRIIDALKKKQKLNIRDDSFDNTSKQLRRHENSSIMSTHRAMVAV
jgi:hypothetical protein